MVTVHSSAYACSTSFAMSFYGFLSPSLLPGSSASSASGCWTLTAWKFPEFHFLTSFYTICYLNFLELLQVSPDLNTQSTSWSLLWKQTSKHQVRGSAVAEGMQQDRLQEAVSLCAGTLAVTCDFKVRLKLLEGKYCAFSESVWSQGCASCKSCWFCHREQGTTKTVLMYLHGMSWDSDVTDHAGMPGSSDLYWTLCLSDPFPWLMNVLRTWMLCVRYLPMYSIRVCIYMYICIRCLCDNRKNYFCLWLEVHYRVFAFFSFFLSPTEKVDIDPIIWCVQVKVPLVGTDLQNQGLALTY